MTPREMKALAIGGLVFVSIMIPLSLYGFIVLVGALIKLLITAFQ